MLFLVVGLVYFGWSTVQNYNLAFVGALVSAIGASAYFIGIYTFYKTPRTTKKLWSFGVIVYLGLVISLAGLQDQPELYMYFGLLFTALNGILWERYVSWYSVYGERNIKIEVGKKIPKGILLNDDGYEFSTSVSVSNIAKQKAIWLFYRGNWCPFCVAQVKELAAHYQEIEKMGYQIIFISSQTAAKSKLLSDKLNINAMFLTDVNNQYGNVTGLTDKSGLPLGLEVLGYQADVFYPTLVITNEQGLVQYLDITDNYRIRPEPEDFLKIIKDLA